MEDVSDSYVDKMLKNHREINKHERQIKRDTVINKRRGILGDFSNVNDQTIKPEQVATIAYKIKHKGKVCEEDLKLLNYGFIQGENNINAFINIPGTLHALVRELSGVSSLTQLAAVECIINLSLGNNICCFKIAKASSPYLITHLQGMNLNLKNSCIWALGNMLGSDIKTWRLLNSQSVLLYILNLLPVPQLQENVIYSLIHYVKTGFNEIVCGDFLKIATAVLELKSCTEDVMWLLYLLSCSNSCDTVLAEVLTVCFDILLKSEISSVKSVLASIRILANIVSEESGRYALVVLDEFDKIHLICDKFMNNYRQLMKELVWFIGNLIHHPSSAVQDRINLYIEKISLLESIFDSSVN